MAWFGTSASEAREEAKSMAPLPSQTHEQERLTGAIRALKVGFGFIAGDDGMNYFFHWSALERTSKKFDELEMQERVSFRIVQNDRGPRAIEIRVLQSAE